jgi:hypothetical protein
MVVDRPGVPASWPIQRRYIRYMNNLVYSLRILIYTLLPRDSALNSTFLFWLCLDNRLFISCRVIIHF